MKLDKHFFRKNFFKMDRYRVSCVKSQEDMREEDEAVVKILVPRNKAEGRIAERYISEYQPKDKDFLALTASANGDGPVDALDKALRKLLVPIYPFIKEVRLVRYSVDNISVKDGTSAEVEVFILSSNSNGKLYFSEVSSRSVVEASYFALANIYNRYFSDEYMAARGGKATAKKAAKKKRSKKK